MFTITVPHTYYFFPEDAESGIQAFLDLLHSPGETWVACFGFSFAPLIGEIIAADKSGVPIHLLLDRTQAAGPTERKEVKRLAESLQHGELTLTTAGGSSKTPGAIFHSKALVTAATDGGEFYCTTGSMNLTKPGPNEANITAFFRSDMFAYNFIASFNAHRDWARLHEARIQVMSM